MGQLARRFMMEKFNEIGLTAEDDLTAEDSVPREMGMRRAVFLLIASLLLWCGSMLLVLDLANVSGNQGQVALIGLFLVAIGGSWLWADFFGVTAWFTREASPPADRRLTGLLGNGRPFLVSPPAKLASNLAKALFQFPLVSKTRGIKGGRWLRSALLLFG
jgi:hypothetical protein